MQIVSDAYKAYMSQPVRPPFHMEITVHTDTPIVYTDNEIFEFEEKKTAHPIGAELPTIEVSFKVDNIAGDYNADSPSGLYEQLIKGVKVTYRYGLEIPNVMPYGYPADEGETEEPIYGADPLNPYGFSPSSTIEWMDGGEVYTTGEISYDKTSATIEAVDALSFLEETADVAYGTINRKQCAQFIIDATEYPEDLLGAKKISIDAILETWNTNVVSDKNAKQVLQSLAHASGVQMYIDRSGYLHLDKIPITTGAVDYHVTLGDQDEDGEFTKGKTPRKVVVKVNTKNVVPEVSETINPKGEDILVENDFVQTTLQAEAVLPWVKRYLAMRNTAEIEYAGDPALDILDIILLDTEYSENIPATIVESIIRFDGSITGSLVLRYDSALADNTTVKITGAENFIYSGETPSPASVTLVCETDMTAPSYEWSYFNDSSSGWQVISGATTANLTILADSAYIVGSNPTSFRVVVRGDEGTKGTTVRIQRIQEAVQQGHTYLGKLTALPSAYDVGDYFLVSTAFSTYGLGDVVQWDGDSWEVMTNPTLIVSVYQDALTLSMPLENTSAVNQYIRSIQTKQILLSTDTPIMFFYEDDTPYDGGQVATITATRRNVIGGINWYINGDLVPDYDEDTIMVYDTDMSGNEITVTAVSVEYASVNAVIKIAKKKDRKLDASNLGLIANGDPTPTVGKEGAPLVAGDYFMWGNPTTSTPDERKKGAVYIYQTNGTWLEDTDGTKTMSMFAQFAELPNDTDSTVMGNTIIKNLVAIKAFIENLDAENITAGTGNGTTGGFRFRAKSRTDLTQPYDATTNPSVFDIYYHDKKLFEVVASGDDAGDVIIGDYANGNGIKYDKSTNKLSVNGTIEAGSVVPVSNVRNGLGQDGNDNNFSTFAYVTTPGFFPEGTNGSFGVSGTTRQTVLCDDFIQVDTTKAYTFDMWAKALYGLATTDHYLFYACYDADKNFIPPPAGNIFNYIASGNLSSPWTKYSTVINGVADGSSPTKFRPGTRFIKIGALFNHSEDAYHEFYIAGITLREATPFSVDGTAFQTANGKVKIHNDGTIEAVDGSFTGNIIANSGLFKGIFDTTALKLEPGTANSHSASYAGNGNQGMNFCNYFESQGLSGGTFYKASIPSGIYNWRYSSSITKQFNGGDVKYVRFNNYTGYCFLSFYDSNLAPLTTSVGDIRLGGVYNEYYVYETLSITLYTGGDVLQLSDDVPLSPANLEAYQIYMNPTTGALMAKLP